MTGQVVVLAHEWGDAVDALARLVQLARGLQRLGWRCVWAGRDLTALHLAVGAKESIWPAPQDWGFGHRAASTPVPQASYASVLMGHGWGDVDSLSSLLQSWQQTLRHLKPDLVVTDGAPGAQWAARLMGIPVVQMGNEFSVPPLSRPMPVLRWWTDAYDGLLQSHDEQVTACLQATLPGLQNDSGRTVESVADALGASLRLIGSPAQLLRDPARADALVWGCAPAQHEAVVVPALASGGGRPYWDGPASHQLVCAALARGDFMLLRPANLEQWLRARWLVQLGRAELIAPSDGTVVRAMCAERATARAAGQQTSPQLPAPTWDTPRLVSHCQALVANYTEIVVD